VREPIETRLAAAGLPPLPRTAWLEIDLAALLANLELLRVAAGRHVRIRAVVKADAYGHGAVPVTRALVAAGVDGLCVATFDEAVALRAAGIEAPILVMYPIPPAWGPEAARSGIAITAGDASLLEAALAAHAADPGTTLRIELEVETGLGRGGFDLDALVVAARTIAAAPAVELVGTWTHLQAPEDPETTAHQLERFAAAGDALRAAGVALPVRHVTASGGLVSDGVAAFDGVRPGLALYGLTPDELSAAQLDTAVGRGLRPVLSLHARPVRVADLPSGWGISYGPTFVTAGASRIATLPLGYGDGWSRALSNRAEALVRGRRVPIVGNVAMDAVMVDVTDVPGSPVTPADEFTLIGTQGDERITVRELARERNTNSWEVVTAMARRLPRVYDAAPGPVGLRTLTERS
jgi:alanine racemase